MYNNIYNGAVRAVSDKGMQASAGEALWELVGEAAGTVRVVR